MKLKIKYKKKTGKTSNMWKLNNTLLKNYWVKQDMKETKIYIEENENTTYQTLEDAAKAVLREKFIALQASRNKKNLHLTLQLEELEKEQMKPIVKRRKEIIKI